MLKEVIDKLTFIYNKYGDLDVIKNDECGGCFDVTPELIKVTEWETKTGGKELTVDPDRDSCIIESETSFEEANINDLTPVSLTPEFFEKNGWEKKGCNRIFI